MKNGRTLQGLAQEIARQQATKRDFCMPTTNLLMYSEEGAEVGLSLLGTDIEMATVLDSTHRQIGTHVGISAKYYDKMREQDPELLATNVNTWFRREPTNRMVRILDGKARAFLSDRYRRIDNAEIAEAVLPIIGDLPDATVESCEITDSRMYIKVVNPRLEAEVVPGDVVQAGVVISNSETGQGSVSVHPLIYRLVCSNGMVINDAGTRKYHTGRSNEISENYEVYTNETREADDKAYLMKVQDIVRAAVDEARFHNALDKMRAATGIKIEGHVPEVVELTAKEFDMSKAEGAGVLRRLIEGGDLSLYGLANAVTRHSQDVPSYDRATDLETIGYEILTINPQVWSRLNSAIK